MTVISSSGEYEKMIVSNENQEGQRIDNFLFKTLKTTPKSHIYRMLRKGSIRVNRKRVKPFYKIKFSDEITLPNIEDSADKKIMPTLNNERRLRDKFIYEDDNLLILNKPSGLCVHGGTSFNFGLIEIVRTLRFDLNFIELAHRLDKGTSGCLILAKNRQILKELHGLFLDGKIKKTYLALLKGHWKKGNYLFSAPLKKGGNDVEKVRIDEYGKMALTEFKPVCHYSNATLMEVILHTGRTHQIRVHAAHLNHPVVGDDKYGDKDFNKEYKKKGLKRLFLHSSALKFNITSLNKYIEIKADLDDNLKSVLQKIENI